MAKAAAILAKRLKWRKRSLKAKSANTAFAGKTAAAKASAGICWQRKPGVYLQLAWLATQRPPASAGESSSAALQQLAAKAS